MWDLPVRVEMKATRVGVRLTFIISFGYNIDLLIIVALSRSADSATPLAILYVLRAVVAFIIMLMLNAACCYTCGGYFAAYTVLLDTECCLLLYVWRLLCCHLLLLYYLLRFC